MLTEQHTRLRRERLWSQLPESITWALVTDPAHLIYFANYYASPFVFNSQGAAAALLLARDGTAVLIADNAQEPFAEQAFVSERILPVWYRCVESAGHRRALLTSTVIERMLACGGKDWAFEATHCPAAIVAGIEAARPGTRWHDLDETIRQLRRAKQPDEVALIRHSLAAATAGLHAAMDELRPGMTEFDAYRLVQRVAHETAGEHVSVYGDFVSGSRCEQGGGPPSNRRIEAGELVLLDFSVVIRGYRGDFANAFICGGKASPAQRALFEACFAAMQAGEKQLRAGIACRDVHETVRAALAERNLADRFPHHTGHGIGLSHPDAPYLVPESAETLLTGDVITLEPGVYVPGVGGVRYERNYLITDSGYELLSLQRVCID